MPELVLAVALAFALGVGVTLLAQLVRRHARGARELGSDADRATFRTLSLASRAAVNLRGGLRGDGAHRATRALRTLLGSDAVAIADERGVISVDGRADSDGAAARLALDLARKRGFAGEPQPFDRVLQVEQALAGFAHGRGEPAHRLVQVLGAAAGNDRSLGIHGDFLSVREGFTASECAASC